MMELLCELQFFPKAAILAELSPAGCWQLLSSFLEVFLLACYALYTLELLCIMNSENTVNLGNILKIDVLHQLVAG